MDPGEKCSVVSITLLTMSYDFFYQGAKVRDSSGCIAVLTIWQLLPTFFFHL